jgi:hypothetical protein
MMKNKIYAVVLKTGDAELKAFENNKIEPNEFFPIIELTRGRKSKNDKVGLIAKRLQKLKSIFKNSTICLDLTTSESLSNIEIDELYSFDNGYHNWIAFLVSLQDEGIFKEIFPTILVNADDPNVEANLISQVDQLTDNFTTIVYRNSLSDDGCYSDIRLISEIIKQKKTNFYFIIDCEYVAPGAWKSFSSKAIYRIEKIQALIDSAKFIIVSTSFPNNVSEIGKEDQDTFGLTEIDLHYEVSKNVDCEVLYGDYGSINPIRNDEIIMSRGWVPRIDVALQFEIYYFRQRRGKSGNYSDTYYSIAQNLVRDSKFPKDLKSNWGVRQVINCSEGYAPGSTPSFWISVRMNMHLEQQMIRLKSKL